MCPHTSNTIVEKENADQKAILHARKYPLNGKRRVIDGKHLMTGTELIGVRKPQEMTDQRKTLKKGKGKQTGGSKVKKESSDDCEEDLYITDDDDNRILNCMVVEK
jgi:hypothetical protein